jgi:hypothetical protein
MGPRACEGICNQHGMAFSRTNRNNSGHGLSPTLTERHDMGVMEIHHRG